MHQTMTDRWNSISLRTKITGVTVLLLTLGLLVSGIGTMAMLKPKLVDQLSTQLQGFAQGKGLENYLSQVQAQQSDDAGQAEGYYVVLVSGDGSTPYSNFDLDDPNAPDLDVSITFSEGQTMSGNKPVLVPSNNGRVDFLVAVTPYYSGLRSTEMGSAIVAVSTKTVDVVMTTYLTIFLGFGVAIVIIGAMLTRLLVTTTFGPLREVERTAAAIADGDFGQRLAGATPNTEVGRLNRSLNIMLSRIDNAFKDRARTIDQMRRFVGDASHELRTPLVSVRGYAELYRMGALQTPEDVAQAMERIEKEAIRMGGLVEDLLELARLDESKPLTLAPVDLMPLARDAAMDAMASWPDRRVTVVTRDVTPHPVEPEQDDTETTGSIPLVSSGTALNQNATGPIAFAGATFARLRSRRPRRTDSETTVGTKAEPIEGLPAMVMAEENKIRQVLTNLIGNAVRYTPEATSIEIGVGVDRSARVALLEVIDHGEGIPPQIREKIFQRFWRADTSRARETGGSGLGLAIVASIVSAHKGQVDVAETPGGGATFRVSLPLLTMTPNTVDSTERG